jgi:anaerobic magnesium-protoporphyrin IX monomethyl ester cyclase
MKRSSHDERPVVLAVAPPGGSDVLDAPTFLGRMPNIGILYLAAALERAGVPCVALDRHYDEVTPFQLASEILGLRPRLIGFTLFDLTMEFTRDTLRVIGLLGDAPVVVGGYTATFHGDEILERWPEVDFVLEREAEESLVALVEHLDGKRPLEDVPGLRCRGDGGLVRTPPAKLPDVERLPWAKHDWAARTDVTPMITRRGCTSRCSFCSMVPFYDLSLGPIVRYRRPEEVVDEIERCLEHGRDELMFYDDDFGLVTKKDRSWCADFCAELRRRAVPVHFGVELRVIDVVRGEDLLRELRDVGLSHMAIGMESMLPRQLALYRKGYKQEDVLAAVEVADAVGVDYQTNVIFWDPWTTLEEADQHLDLLDSIRIQDQLSSANYPFYAGTLTARRGTSVHEHLTELGLLRRSPHAFYRFEYDFQDPEAAAFHETVLFDFLQRSRRTLKRPPTLWLLVPRLHHVGLHELAEEFRAAGRKLAQADFEYFRALVTLSRDRLHDPELDASLAELHRSMEPRIRECVGAFPRLPPDALRRIGFPEPPRSAVPARRR